MNTTAFFNKAIQNALSVQCNFCCPLEEAFTTFLNSKIDLLQQKKEIFYIVLCNERQLLSDKILNYTSIIQNASQLFLQTFPSGNDKKLITNKISTGYDLCLVAAKTKSESIIEIMVVSSLLCHPSLQGVYISYGATHDGKYSMSIDHRGDNLVW